MKQVPVHSWMHNCDYQSNTTFSLDPGSYILTANRPVTGLRLVDSSGFVGLEAAGPFKVVATGNFTLHSPAERCVLDIFKLED